MRAVDSEKERSEILENDETNRVVGVRCGKKNQKRGRK